MEYASGIYLYNLDVGKFLIGHVTNTKGAYSIPKGRVDIRDDNAFETATRELKEETNLDLNELDIVDIIELPIIKYNNSDVSLVSFLVLCNLGIEEIDCKCISTFKTSDNKEKPEIDTFLWVTIDEAKKYLPISQKQNLSKISQIIRNLENFIF